MDKVLLFDTSQGSRNLGDYIINQSIRSEMNNILQDRFVVKVPTQTPIMNGCQKAFDFCDKGFWSELYSADYKFLCGTNLFKMSLLKLRKEWNIGLSDIRMYKGAISVGCGMHSNSSKLDLYTKKIYKSILNKEFIHSARDEKTKKFLNNLGFKAVDTGCATLWSLNEEHCLKIPKEKSRQVVFTLTDYVQDRNSDQLLIDILKKNYEDVYYWPQGYNDMLYFNTLSNIQDIKVLGGNLEAYTDFLDNANTDYVGTRLHGGIFAMQHYKRTIIISVDERAMEMDKTHNLKCICRDKLNDLLEEQINSSWSTEIKINQKEINNWKEQFI